MNFGIGDSIGDVLGLIVQVEGLGDFWQLQQRLRARAERPFTSDVGERVRDLYVNVVKDQIATSGGRSGGYAPLSHPYAERKASRFPGRPILVATGEMGAAVGNPSHRDFIYDRTVKSWSEESFTFAGGSNQIELGSKSEIAGYHQDGTDNMPARPVFVNDAKFGEEVGNAVLSSIFKPSLTGLLAG